MIQVTTQSDLNARSGKPYTNSPNPFYWPQGHTISITDTVVGEEIEGNSLWYKGADGNFYWSGGVLDEEFVWPDGDFAQLAKNDKIGVLKSLKSEKYNWYRQRVPELTSMGIGFKNDIIQGELCLVFYVTRKTPAGSVEAVIPKTIDYKGWRVPTDVKESGKLVSHQYVSGNKGSNTAADINPLLCGGSISSWNKQNYGTRTLKVQVDGQTCLLTCFHVVFGSLINSTDSLQFPGLEGADLPIMATAPSSIVNKNYPSALNLKAYKGQYDNFYDFALLTFGNAQITNAIPGQLNSILQIKGFYDESELAQQLRLTCFGATSGPQTGTITDLSQDTDLPVNGQQRHYKDLLVSEKIAEPGDSGAPVLGPDNRIVGYVVGGTLPGDPTDPPRTYILPWYNLYYNQSITII